MTSPYFSFIDPNQVDPLAGYAPPGEAGPTGTPALAPIISSGVQAGPHLGLLAKIFGGADPLQGGVLSPQQVPGLGRQALRQASLNLLQNSGPAPYRHGIGELLGTALNAGQQAYDQGAQQVQAQAQTVAQRLAASRLNALRARYAGRTDPASLAAYMSGLIGEGDYHGASAISEYLKSQRETQDPALSTITGISGSALGLDPHKTYTVQRNRQGQIVGTPLEVTPDTKPNGGMSPEQARLEGNTFLQYHFDPQVRNAVRAYHIFQSHLGQAAQANPEAYKSLITAFASSADAKAQLRLGVLNYLSEVNPSAVGRAQVMLDKLESGTLPQADLRRLAAIVQDNFRAARSQYQDAYEGQVGRLPESSRYIPKVEELFKEAPVAGVNEGADPFGHLGRP